MPAPCDEAKRYCAAFTRRCVSQHSPGILVRLVAGNRQHAECNVGGRPTSGRVRREKEGPLVPETLAARHSAIAWLTRAILRASWALTEDSE